MSLDCCKILIEQKHSQGAYITENIKDGVQLNRFQAFLLKGNIMVSLLNNDIGGYLYL